MECRVKEKDKWMMVILVAVAVLVFHFVSELIQWGAW